MDWCDMPIAILTHPQVDFERTVDYVLAENAALASCTAPRYGLRDTSDRAVPHVHKPRRLVAKSLDKPFRVCCIELEPRLEPAPASIPGIDTDFATAVSQHDFNLTITENRDIFLLEACHCESW